VPPWHPGDGTDTFVKERAFPGDAESKRASARVWRFPIINWSFGLLLGAFWLFVSWALQSATRASAGLMMQSLAAVPFSPAVITKIIVQAFEYSPGSVVFLALFTGGCFAFCKARTRAMRVILGLIHALAHVLVWIFLLWAFAHTNLNFFQLRCGSGGNALLSITEGLFAGGLIHGFVFAAYLAVVSRFVPGHADDIFSALGIEDMKNFLRLHIDGAGRLTVYPVGIRSVVHDFGLRPDAPAAAPWFESRELAERIVERARLIEKPITIGG
jgi:hypothetical protein